MFKFFNKKQTTEIKLYNKILSLSRNKLFYTKFCLDDTFQNRINLIFLHISFLFIKSKEKKQSQSYHVFFQKSFDLMFNKIEINMREIGYGDMNVNKKMKFLVKFFYKVLLDCESYKKKSLIAKTLFLSNYLTLNKEQKSAYVNELVKYFDKYQAFCFDLSSVSVLSGDLDFKYN